MIRLALIATILAGTASAQECLPIADARAGLFARYGEIPSGAGDLGEGSTGVLFVNPTTRTWTVLAIGPGGRACGILAGLDWAFFGSPS